MGKKIAKKKLPNLYPQKPNNKVSVNNFSKVSYPSARDSVNRRFYDNKIL